MNKLKESIKELYQDAKDLIRDTSVEVYVMAALGLAVATTTSYKIEQKRTHLIPLGFSEISQIERDAKRAHQNLGPLTQLLAFTNDGTMKVFECSNDSHDGIFEKEYQRRFAKEIDMRMEPTYKVHHYNLNDILDKLPDLAVKSLAALKDFVAVQNRLNHVNDMFNRAWEDHHTDNYILVPVITTDSEGNTHTDWEEEYVDTTHEYIYHREFGEEASRSLDQLVTDYPKLNLREKLRTPSQTNAEGEYASEKSRIRKRKDKPLDQEDFLAISSRWATGSTLMSNLPGVKANLAALHSYSNLWRRAKNNSHGDTYNTGSHFDDGPKEFQIAETTLKHGTTLYQLISEITGGISYAGTQAPILDDRIRDLVAVTFDGKKGNPKKLTNEIMSISKNMYNYNFKNGFDVNRFRGEMILLWGLIGGLSGALVGYGIDKLGNYLRKNNSDYF